jgi:hypothetical protein
VTLDRCLAFGQEVFFVVSVSKTFQQQIHYVGPPSVPATHHVVVVVLLLLLLYSSSSAG